MRLRRPSARLSELAFAVIGGAMAMFYLVTLWPAPDLDVSPAWCRPKYSQFTGDGPARGVLPPSYERYNR